MARSLNDGLRAALRQLGIEPDDTRRVIIDIRANEPVKIYVDRYGDDPCLLQVLGELSDPQIIYAPPNEDEKR
jgi:hypothetical protein